MELILLIRGAVKCRVTSNRRPILASQLVSTGLYCLHAKSQRGIDDVSRARSSVELLLVHPGGPFWKKKDEGAWSIPKGEVSAEEDALDTARREFCEETGIFPEAQFLPLGQILQKGGKVVRAWAFEGDCDPAALKSNTFTMEWPPRSGKKQEFPEIDRAAFFTLAEARKRINPAQAAFIDALERIASDRSRQPD